MPEPLVLHHTLLERRGGAARVAALLVEARRTAGLPVALNFEVAETRSGEPVAANWPRRLRDALRAGELVHLHGSRDWSELLELCLQERGPNARLLLTAHDASLATGGCPYPLDCPNFAQECREPCPRDFPQSQARRARQRELLLALAPALVSPSAWLRRLLMTALPELPVTVIPNGVEWPASQPGRDEREAARRSFGLGPQARLCLFIAHGGVQAAYKAGDHWRALWRSIQTEIPDGVAFFIGGDKTEQPEPGLFCWPYLEQEQLRAAFLAAELFVYPTLADNHPLLVLEAMAWGCPVLSFAVGGIPEQIKDKQTGRLIRPGDAPALLAASIELLKDRRQARLLAERAFARGQERFAVGRMAAEYELAYARARQGAGAPPQTGLGG